MKIALLQTPVSLSKDENLITAGEFIEEAANGNADLAVLPEMFCCPYSNEYFREFAEPVHGKAWSFLAENARKYGLYLVGGSFPELDSGMVYNTSFVFNRNGEQVARHRKMHLFDIDIAGGQRFFESETFSAGNEVTVFDTEYGCIGLCVCFDMRFPELSRLMTLRGAKVIIVPAAFNMTTGPMHWETMFRQRATDDQVFTIGVAPARDENGIYVSYANSILCSPWGAVLARAGSAPEIITSDIDLSNTDDVRTQLPLLSARREDVYSINNTRDVR